MVNIIYKPYEFKFKQLLLKRKIFINNIIYYPLKYYDTNDTKYNNIIIQSPIMFIPFDLSNYNSINNYIDISFLNKEKDADINEFFLFITKINNYFSKLKKFKHLKFRSSLKPIINIFPERLRLNFNKRNNILVFNEEKQRIDKSSIKSKMYGKFLIQISNIWINKSNNEYGIIWNICQVKLYENLIYKPDEYSFIDDNNYKETDDINSSNPQYKQYFFMLKLGLSRETIIHKLIQDNMDPALIDIITEKKNNPKEKFETIKKKDITRTNLLNSINSGINLKKIKIVKKKSLTNNNNNLVPSQEDILSAWTKIVKKK